VVWTPGYWGFAGAAYVFHAGYWGPHVGFYGGVNYGHGYTGAGYAGGRWVGNSFAYNREVTNINVTVVHNVYVEHVNVVTANRASYNGGNGGVRAAASQEERQWEREPRAAPTPIQTQHVHDAAGNPALFVRANNGRPPIAATPRPASFTAPGVIGTRGAAAIANPTPAPTTPQRQTNFNTPNSYGGGPNNYRPPASNGSATPNYPRPPANYSQQPIKGPTAPISPTPPSVNHTSPQATTVHLPANQQVNVARPATTPAPPPPARQQQTRPPPQLQQKGQNKKDVN
jgi:hypothetical protein